VPGGVDVLRCGWEEEEEKKKKITRREKQ